MTFLYTNNFRVYAPDGRLTFEGSFPSHEPREVPSRADVIHRLTGIGLFDVKIIESIQRISTRKIKNWDDYNYHEVGSQPSMSVEVDDVFS